MKLVTTTVRIMADGTPGYTESHSDEIQSLYEEIWKHLPISFGETQGYTRFAQIPAGWHEVPRWDGQGEVDFYDEWDDLVFHYTNNLGSWSYISTIPVTDLIVSGNPVSDAEVQAFIETYEQIRNRLIELAAAYAEVERLRVERESRSIYQMARERIGRAIARQPDPPNLWNERRK